MPPAGTATEVDGAAVVEGAADVVGAAVVEGAAGVDVASLVGAADEDAADELAAGALLTAGESSEQADRPSTPTLRPAMTRPVRAVRRMQSP
ncbi:hypothetical protein VV01_11340 [Luteipulveratus halotolerans]|uniref:Uncharacterized protein n=1 Tax=Luteipulveratus halotolerans TaxID=1631356 RepID=A0A0L6CJ22_9MICO|nr:hypothetical protein VV01_11340 [Luteipulveratus halotolerans]